ncbi:MAG: hypothetical protein MUF82_07540 [Bacteroidetes bacterium]|jgi:hypothetical protein|nr:hypothetical protein [Bacteroidota bacterium]
MSTKPPSAVKEHSADSLEKKAYQIVADIPTQEPNDRNRLGFCLWIWMQDRKGTLEEAVRAAGVRGPKSVEELVAIIKPRLEA